MWFAYLTTQRIQTQDCGPVPPGAVVFPHPHHTLAQQPLEWTAAQCSGSCPHPSTAGYHYPHGAFLPLVPTQQSSPGSEEKCSWADLKDSASDSWAEVSRSQKNRICNTIFKFTYKCITVERIIFLHHHFTRLSLVESRVVESEQSNF